MGVDGLKLYAGLRPEFIARAVARADGRVPVAAHLGRTWPSEAAQAGVNCLEHLIASLYQGVARPEDRHGRDDGFGDDPDYWNFRLVRGWANADLNADYVRQIIELLVSKSVYVCATMVLSAKMMKVYPSGSSAMESDDADVLDMPWSLRRDLEIRQANGEHQVRRGSVPQWKRHGYQHMGERDDIPEAVPHGYVELAVRQKALEHLLRFLRIFHDAGGKLLIGTDTPGDVGVVPGLSLHSELELFAAAGLDPLTIIRIASQQAAEAMRRANDQGSLTPGKRADAVLLTADPMADIRNTRKIELVIKDGVRYRPEVLSQREDRSVSGPQTGT
jgi:hypothetical protein